MSSLTQLSVTKYRALLKALEKPIHDKNHLLPRVCTGEETHSRDWLLGSRAEGGLEGPWLSPTVAHTHRACLSGGQCWGLPCSNAGDAGRAMVAFRVRPMSIQVTDEDMLFRVHFNKETQ